MCGSRLSYYSAKSCHCPNPNLHPPSPEHDHSRVLAAVPQLNATTLGPLQHARLIPPTASSQPTPPAVHSTSPLPIVTFTVTFTRLHFPIYHITTILHPHNAVKEGQCRAPEHIRVCHDPENAWVRRASTVRGGTALELTVLFFSPGASFPSQLASSHRPSSRALLR